jgi:hypothetical protein
VVVHALDLPLAEHYLDWTAMREARFVAQRVRLKRGHPNRPRRSTVFGLLINKSGLNMDRYLECSSITLRVDANASEEVYVELVGPLRYRLEVTPIVANLEDDPLYGGDVIEAEPLPDGTHRLVRVIERSPMRHFDWIVPRRFVESAEYARFGAAVEAEGGWWESAFGGLLWVHLPTASAFDPQAELSRRIAAAQASAPDA